MTKKKKKISKKDVICEYKIVCNEDNNCPCKLANTKKVQVVFDSMSHSLK